MDDFTNKLAQRWLPYLFKMVAIDTSFGKRSLMMKVKTKAIMKIIFAIFRLFHKFIVRQSEKNNH